MTSAIAVHRPGEHLGDDPAADIAEPPAPAGPRGTGARVARIIAMMRRATDLGTAAVVIAWRTGRIVVGLSSGAIIPNLPVRRAIIGPSWSQGFLIFDFNDTSIVTAEPSY